VGIGLWSKAVLYIGIECHLGRKLGEVEGVIIGWWYMYSLEGIQTRSIDTWMVTVIVRGGNSQMAPYSLNCALPVCVLLVQSEQG
jgi:hypothetical protein